MVSCVTVIRRCHISTAQNAGAARRMEMAGEALSECPTSGQDTDSHRKGNPSSEDLHSYSSTQFSERWLRRHFSKVFRQRFFGGYLHLKNAEINSLVARAYKYTVYTRSTAV